MSEPPAPKRHKPQKEEEEEEEEEEKILYQVLHHYPGLLDESFSDDDDDDDDKDEKRLTPPLLAQGSSGSIFKVEWKDKIWALKKTRASWNTLQELKVLTHLKTHCSQNILCFQESVYVKPWLFILTEMLNGFVDLDELPTSFLQDEKQNQPNSDKILLLVCNLFNALSQIHSQGVSHNDLHGRNVMVHPKTLQVKIVDFGLASLGFNETNFERQKRDVQDVQNTMSEFFLRWLAETGSYAVAEMEERIKLTMTRIREKKREREREINLMSVSPTYQEFEDWKKGSRRPVPQVPRRQEENKLAHSEQSLRFIDPSSVRSGSISRQKEEKFSCDSIVTQDVCHGIEKCEWKKDKGCSLKPGQRLTNEDIEIIQAILISLSNNKQKEEKASEREFPLGWTKKIKGYDQVNRHLWDVERSLLGLIGNEDDRYVFPPEKLNFPEFVADILSRTHSKRKHEEYEDEDEDEDSDPSESYINWKVHLLSPKKWKELYNFLLRRQTTLPREFLLHDGNRGTMTKWFEHFDQTFPLAKDPEIIQYAKNLGKNVAVLAGR